MKIIKTVMVAAAVAGLAACGDNDNDQANNTSDMNATTDMNAGMTDMNATLPADNVTLEANNVTVVNGTDANASMNADTNVTTNSQ